MSLDGGPGKSPHKYFVKSTDRRSHCCLSNLSMTVEIRMFERFLLNLLNSTDNADTEVIDKQDTI